MNAMIQSLILDDEPLPVELLKSYVSRIPELHLAGTFHDPLAARDFIVKERVDLLFLDIEMPHLNGLEFFRSLPVKPLTIFTTAYPDFAVDGFALNAVDYLLKPFDFDRFHQAVKRALEYHAFLQLPKGRAPEPFILVKSEYKVVRISVSDILYIEGMDSYVKIYAGGKPVLSLMSMKGMMDLLPESEFLRVHRSFIVPVGRIQSIRNKTIHIGNQQIPIGGTYESVVEEWMKTGKAGKN